MPYISVTLAGKLDDPAKEKLARAIGEKITLLPGKNEAGLMIHVDDGRPLFFAGAATENGAFVDVRLFGESILEAKEAFTLAMKELLYEICGVEGMYLNYIELKNWGTEKGLR